MEKMKMGILGSGGIAHTMANTVKQMADVEGQNSGKGPELC